VRVGGRLKNSEFAIDKKHPIVLNANHLFTNLLFTNKHLRLLYAGHNCFYSLYVSVFGQSEIEI